MMTDTRLVPTNATISTARVVVQASGEASRTTMIELSRSGVLTPAQSLRKRVRRSCSHVRLAVG
jgi:short subunit dehydrogenase-like uncharacterized protein